MADKEKPADDVGDKEGPDLGTMLEELRAGAEHKIVRLGFTLRKDDAGRLRVIGIQPDTSGGSTSGGSSGVREPRTPSPSAGSGAAQLEP